MEKRIGNKGIPITNDELQEEISLRYERLSLVAETTENNDLMEEKAMLTTQSQGKCQDCGHKATDCKARRDQKQRVETQSICDYFKKPEYYKADCFKLLRKN
jgi:hypothetical protein